MTDILLLGPVKFTVRRDKFEALTYTHVVFKPREPVMYVFYDLEQNIQKDSFLISRFLSDLTAHCFE